MKKASFVMYFHSRRIDNLNQTIRLLKKREPDLDLEMILVCQDQISEKDIFCPFPKRLYNMGLKNYNKPIMVNFGVSKSQNDVLVILDSDRVLPKGYFTRYINEVEDKSVITAEFTKKLLHECTDDEINKKEFKFYQENRSKKEEMQRKNMFSGNTIMLLRNFLSSGGMDESFVGYGYNDTDFSQHLRKLGYRFIFLPVEEIHLYHEPIMPKAEFRKSNVKNGIKYCKKWDIPPDANLIESGRLANIDVAKEVAKPLFRYTLGPVSNTGFHLFLRSAEKMASIYPEVDIVICVNQCKKERLNALMNMGFEVVVQENRITELCQPALAGKYFHWKLYPPRLRTWSHELFLDNDIYIFKRLQKIDKFLYSDNFLLYEGLGRNFGVFDKFVPNGLRINSGIFGIPPHFDFTNELNALLKLCKWESRFDEQGLIAAVLSKYKYRIVSQTDVPIIEPWFDIEPFERNVDFCGYHFVQSNFEKNENVKKRFLKL